MSEKAGPHEHPQDRTENTSVQLRKTRCVNKSLLLVVCCDRGAVTPGVPVKVLAIRIWDKFNALLSVGSMWLRADSFLWQRPRSEDEEEKYLQSYFTECKSFFFIFFYC